MAADTCVINWCPDVQGAGTWVRIKGVEGVLPVCERHWQAIGAVAYMMVQDRNRK